VDAGFEDPTKQPLDEAGFLQDIGLIALVAVIAIVLGVIIARKLVDRRLARPARLVDNELVTLIGVVRAAGATLTAPLSGRTCVAYRAHARIVAGSERPDAPIGAAEPGVTAEPTEVEHVSFTLETANGPIGIDGERLELAVTPERVVPAQPGRELALLERHDLAALHHKAGFDEIAIEPGAKIAMRGLLRFEVDALAAGERGYREEAPRRMRLLAPGDDAIKVVRIWS
jgi:hypothetical protein